MNNLETNQNITDSTNLEVTYRQARNTYNKITDYGNSARFKPELIPPNNDYLNGDIFLLHAVPCHQYFLI